jgi:hypothetical protein
MLRSTAFAPSRRAAVVLAACAVAVVAACADVTSPAAGTPAAASATVSEAASPAEDAGLSAATREALADTRAATARYHDVERAIADGYMRTGECVAHPKPGVGAMGVHYVNVDLVGDPTLDPARPEILVYEPQKNGRMRLVAAEWMVIAAMYPGGSPTLFGRQLENGPQLPGPGGVPTATYALHAWTWAHNPAGMFAAFNPSVSCEFEQPSGEPDAHAHH